MARVSIGRAYDPVEVDLWGSTYETVDITRSVAKKATGLEEALDSGAQGDDAVRLIGDLLDLKLTSTNGNRKKPSTLINEKWKADELSIRQLLSFIETLAEAERPT